MNMDKYDLTHVISGFLDRQLVVPFLEFLSGKGIYKEEHLQRARIKLHMETKMVDAVFEIFETIGEEPPEELRLKKTAIIEEYMNREQSIQTIVSAIEIIQNDDKKSLDLESLQKELGSDAIEAVHELYHYGKLQYDIGNYGAAIEFLNLYGALAPSSDKYSMSVVWGTLACQILSQQWEPALEDLKRVRNIIEQNAATTNPLQSLQQRTWLIHWGLFVYFNYPKGRDLLIDHYLHQDQQYLNAIQTQCPHILRYLAVAVITNKRRRNVMKDLVRLIEQESYAYKDPITEFISCLYVDYDFDGAQRKLKECEAVITNDFFLTACTADFMENARLFIFEIFCRIHQVISIDMLAEKLNMDPQEAEKWIVNLIRDARMDAKIDSQKGHVLMGSMDVSVYQQVLDKIRGLLFRSQVLCNNLEKLAESKSDTFAVGWGADNF
jgi:translation initiation factor 3 subunit E